MNDLIWNPIDSAPYDDPVIIADQDRWVQARKLKLSAIEFSWTWPFVSFEPQDFWVSVGTRRAEPIEINATHWAYLRVNPPPAVRT